MNDRDNRSAYRICWRDPNGKTNSGPAFKADRASAEEVVSRLNLQFPNYWLEQVHAPGGDQ